MTVDPSIRIYIKEIESRTMFVIKTVYDLELLTRETIKTLGSTKSETTKN